MEDKDIKLIKEIIKEYSTMDGLKEYTKALEKLLQAYKQDEKVIEEMLNVIYELACLRPITVFKLLNFNIKECDEKCCLDDRNCKQCIIDYFRKKCE